MVKEEKPHRFLPIAFIPPQLQLTLDAQDLKTKMSQRHTLNQQFRYIIDKSKTAMGRQNPRIGKKNQSCSTGAENKVVKWSQKHLKL